jgi:hypothetical protein
MVKSNSVAVKLAALFWVGILCYPRTNLWLRLPDAVQTDQVFRTRAFNYKVILLFKDSSFAK